MQDKMTKFQYEGFLSKEVVSEQISRDLQEFGYTIVETDFERPWGGYHKIADTQAEKFISDFFQGVELPEIPDGASVSPKFLVIEEGKQLSWQVHQRRAEFWRVIDGPVGIYLSQTDIQPVEPQVFQNGETVNMSVGTRHRLAGLKRRGIVAEIWIHVDANNPSDELDIRRITDDFGRESK